MASAMRGQACKGLVRFGRLRESNSKPLWRPSAELIELDSTPSARLGNDRKAVRRQKESSELMESNSYQSFAPCLLRTGKGSC